MPGFSGGTAFIAVRPEMKGFGKAVSSEASAAGTEAGGRFSSGFSKVIAAGAALGIGAALGTGFSKALDSARLNDKLAASLGATPKTAKKYADIAGRVYSGAWGDSMEDVNSAIGSVASAFPKLGKKAGPELEKMTQKALDFSGIFDVDVPRAMNVASTVVKSGLAKNAGDALDLITRSAQKVPAELRDGVLDAAEEYSGFFNTLGIKGPQAFSILAKGAEKGQFGIDKAGDAVKEFTIRSTDLSESTKDAYSAIGLNTEKVTKDILAGGKTANKATQSVIKGLLGIKDPGKQAEAAIALFGTPLEDLNVKEIPQFLKGLQGGQKGLKGWKGSLKEAGDTLNDNASTKITAFKRTLETAFVEVLGGKVIPKLEEWADWIKAEAVPALKDMIKFVKDNSTAFTILGGILAAGTAALYAYKAATAIATAWTKRQAVMQALLNKTMLLNPFGLVVAAIAALVVGMVIAYKKSDKFRAIVDKAWAGIKRAVKVAWDGYIKPALKAFWKFITDTLWPAIQWLWEKVVKPVFKAIGSAIKFAWDKVIKPVLKAWWAYVSNVLWPVLKFLWEKVVKPVFKSIGTAIRFAWNNVIKPVFTALKDFVRDKLVPAFRKGVGAIKSIWSSLKSAAAKPVNFVIDTVYNNGIRKAFNWISGKLGGPELPKMPTVSTGGSSGGPNIAKAGAEHGGLASIGGKGRLPDHLEAMGGPFSWAKKVVGKGFNWLTDKMTGAVMPLLGKIGDTPWAKMMGGAAKQIMGMATDFFKGDSDLKKPTIGAKGSVLPAGSYSIGMPYLGYPGHYGSDYPAATGTPVYAMSSGKVSRAMSLTGSYGKHAYIQHPGGIETRYAHLSALGVSPGQMVQAGQMIGRVGSTGNSTGPHLHFEYRRNGSPVNPAGLGIFDSGGKLPTGLSAVFNGTGKTEAVLTSQQWRDMHTLATRATSADSSQRPIHVNMPATATPEAAAAAAGGRIASELAAVGW